MSLRKINVDGAVWEYRIGKGAAVLVAPDGKKAVVGLDKLTGRSWDTLERGQWKRTSDGMVTPKDVAAYIRAL